jgi:tryptophan synthase alpha chain
VVTITNPDRLTGALRVPDGLALIPYLMAGFPDRARSIELGYLYARAGAAAIEVGIPFSDPLADGSVIQQAGQEALSQGMTVLGAIEVAGEVATHGVPVVLMTYVNPMLSFGVEGFARDAAAAGVAGVIVPDLPVEESEGVVEALRQAGVDTIFLIAPTSPEERVIEICHHSQGFVYCVTLTGVTGARSQLEPGLGQLLGRVRAHTDLPLAAGFGISRPEHIATLRGHVDAAVVASALLAEVQAGKDPRHLLEDLRAACQ